MDDNDWEQVRHLLTRLNKGSLSTRARSSGHLVELRGTGAQDPGLQVCQERRRKTGAGAKSCGLGWGSRPQWQRTRETLGERLPCLGSARGGSTAWTRPEWVKASGSQPGSSLGHWDLQTGVQIPAWPLLTLKSLLESHFRHLQKRDNRPFKRRQQQRARLDFLGSNPSSATYQACDLEAISVTCLSLYLVEVVVPTGRIAVRIQ